MARCASGDIQSTYFLFKFSIPFLFYSHNVLISILIMLLAADSYWILSSSNFRDLACQR